VREVIEARGLFSALYTDRGSHYWTTPEAGGKVDKVNLTQFGGICAVTHSRFTGRKGADISSQNNFLDDSLTRHLTILSAEYRKNSSAPVFRPLNSLAGAIGLCWKTPQ
jgi:hypothetical protein